MKALRIPAFLAGFAVCVSSYSGKPDEPYAVAWLALLANTKCPALTREESEEHSSNMKFVEQLLVDANGDRKALGPQLQFAFYAASTVTKQGCTEEVKSVVVRGSFYSTQMYVQAAREGLQTDREGTLKKIREGVPLFTPNGSSPDPKKDR